MYRRLSFPVIAVIIAFLVLALGLFMLAYEDIRDTRAPALSETPVLLFETKEGLRTYQFTTQDGVDCFVSYVKGEGEDNVKEVAGWCSK